VYRKLSLRLQDYKLFRLSVVYGIGLVGILFAGVPLSMKISESSDLVQREQDRAQLIDEINGMRSMKRQYMKHINQNADMDSWVTYLLQATRDCDLRIADYKPAGAGTQMGNLRGAVLQCRMEGTYNNFYKFVVWLENNPWGSRLLSLRLKQNNAKTTDLEGTFLIAVLVNPNRKALPAAESPEGKKGLPSGAAAKGGESTEAPARLGEGAEAATTPEAAAPSGKDSSHE
jgi:hypothetical protein